MATSWLKRNRFAMYGVLRSALVVGLFATALMPRVFAQSEVVPTVADLLARAESFFSKWDSVQWTQSQRKLYLDPKTAEWVEHGIATSLEAWDASRWHIYEKSMERSWQYETFFFASGREGIGASDTALMAIWEFRPPTAGEMESLDQSWMDERSAAVVKDSSVSWYDGGAGVAEYSRSHPGRNRLLNGKYTLGNASPELNVLDLFRPVEACTVESVTMLERPCWRVSHARGTSGGTVSITICPSLDSAPVQFTQSLSANDDYGNGVRVRDGLDNSGSRFETAELRFTLESVNDDWTEFSIRDWILNQLENDTRIGFGSVTEFVDVERPATEEALRMQYAIPDGTKVFMQDTPQLKAEWRDGKVVRAYDGQVIKELAKVEMAAPKPSTWRWVLAGGCLCATVVGGWWLWKSRRSQSKVVPTRNRI